jgi:hypothetical protein
VQEKEEILHVAWAWFCSLIRGVMNCPFAKNELLDIFYNGLTDESRTYMDSCAGCVFRQRTPTEAEELMAKISKNYDDWHIPESTPTPKKRGMIECIAHTSILSFAMEALRAMDTVATQRHLRRQGLAGSAMKASGEGSGCGNWRPKCRGWRGYGNFSFCWVVREWVPYISSTT